MVEDRIVLQKEMEGASKSAKSHYEAVVEYTKEGIKSSKDFYNRLVLVAGGAISLSITFVGYLVSIEGYRVQYVEALVAAWIALFLAMIGSLYRNQFHSHFLHWQILKMYAESKSKEEKTAQKVLKDAPELIYNAKTLEDVHALVSVSKTRTDTYEEAASHNAAKEKTAEKLWQLSKYSAHLGIVLGFLLLLIFSVTNVVLLTL